MHFAVLTVAVLLALQVVSAAQLGHLNGHQGFVKQRRSIEKDQENPKKDLHKRELALFKNLGEVSTELMSKVENKVPLTAEEQAHYNQLSQLAENFKKFGGQGASTPASNVRNWYVPSSGYHPAPIGMYPPVDTYALKQEVLKEAESKVEPLTGVVQTHEARLDGHEAQIVRNAENIEAIRAPFWKSGSGWMRLGIGGTVGLSVAVALAYQQNAIRRLQHATTQQNDTLSKLQGGQTTSYPTPSYARGSTSGSTGTSGTSGTSSSDSKNTFV